MKNAIIAMAVALACTAVRAEAVHIDFIAKDAYQQDLPWEPRVFGPFPEISGSFDVTADLVLSGFSLTIGQKTYGFNDVAMTQGADQSMYLGAVSSGSDGVLAGTDDFLLIWDPMRVAPVSFKYTLAALPSGAPTFGIWSTSNVSFTPSAVPEASSAAMLFTGLLAIGAAWGRGRPLKRS